jgi:hypothetical protein
MPIESRVEAVYAARWTIEDTSGEMTVTEAEWLACTAPQKMLNILEGKVSERKLRLFAVACCRRFRTFMTDEDWAVVEAAEMFAEGRLSRWRLRKRLRFADASWREHSTFPQNFAANYPIRQALSVIEWTGPGLLVGDAANSLLIAAYWSGPKGYDRANINARYAARETERTMQVTTVRCLFSNPFCPVSLAPTILVWNDRVVVRLAQAAYEDRHLPEGTLDNTQLLILADALEEAGCTNADVLGHLRGPGPHVRGCWVDDLCLGKS